MKAPKTYDNVEGLTGPSVARAIGTCTGFWNYRVLICVEGIEGKRELFNGLKKEFVVNKVENNMHVATDFYNNDEFFYFSNASKIQICTYLELGKYMNSVSGFHRVLVDLNCPHYEDTLAYASSKTAPYILSSCHQDSPGFAKGYVSTKNIEGFLDNL